MVTNITPKFKKGQYAGTSADQKPMDVQNGSVYHEVDTGKYYMYDAEGKQWYEQKDNGSGGGGGATSWDKLKNKPFDELNPAEMEINGVEPNRQLGIKEIAISKVIGLDNRLSSIDTEIDNKQPKGDYALKSEVPTKISELQNDNNYVDQVALNAVDIKVDANIQSIQTNADAIKLKADKSEIPTATSDLTNDSGFITTPVYKVISETATTREISPNIFHKWGEMASLTVTLGAELPGVVNEYVFEFKSGASPTTLSVPDTVKWITPLKVEAQKTYQVSILNGLGVIGGA